MAPEMVYRDHRLAELAADAAGALEAVLPERPEVRYEPPAHVQMDAGLSAMLILLGSAVGSGVGAAVGEDIWKAAKKLFVTGVRRIRDEDRSGADVHGFGLRLVWGEREQHSIQLANYDVSDLESLEALDRLTLEQLQPFDDLVIPALRWWEESSEPPGSLLITCDAGAGRDSKCMWQVMVGFGEEVHRGDTLTFCVSGEGELTWISRRPEHLPIPALLDR